MPSNLVWTTEGDLEWTECGPLKAVITRVVTELGSEVGVTVRFILAGEPDGDFVTPAVRHFPAGRLDAELARLKETIERDLRARAAEIAAAATRDTERDDGETDRLPTVEPARSPGFYSVQPTRKGG